MAFIMKQSQTAFFNSVFGPGSVVADKVKKLIAAGVSFDVSLYSLTATYQNQTHLVSVTKSTTALMKAEGLDAAVLEQNKVVVADWVEKLYSLIVDVPVGAMTPSLAQAIAGGETTVILVGGDSSHLLLLIKAIQSVTGLSLLSAKNVAQGVIAGTPKELKTFPTYNEAFEAATLLKNAKGNVELSSKGDHKISMASAMAGAAAAAKKFSAAVADKPVDAVLSLRDAKALGQKVKGTSSGSVYHCIALGEHVRLAAKLYQSGMISVRVEWTDNPKDDLKKLEAAGVQMKQNYGSIHFDSQGVPIERCVGAFLMGTGINWKSVVTNAGELVIGGKS